jgi:MOSC domain-containing protein YiiM
MDLSFRFDAWFRALPRSPRETGRVERCVLRTGPGQRATPAEVAVEPGRGVAGDHWGRYAYDEAGNEVSLVNVHVLRSLAGGDEAAMALSGDNFQVDLDLSEENLPVGTELVIGGAVLRVSALPHRPCRKFVQRFGATAAKKVARANRVGRRGRGVLCEVIRGGTIRAGDEIAVHRAESSSAVSTR